MWGGQDKRKVHAAQVSMGERTGNEKGRERTGKREEDIRRRMRGETLTSEMLSALAADMTASVPIDRAISLPSPVACYSLVWHSTAPGPIVSQGFVRNNICICQHRFYSLLGFYFSSKVFWGFSWPWLHTLKCP